MSSVRSRHIPPEPSGSSAATPQTTAGDTSVPRECWLDASPAGDQLCPRCHTELVPTYQAYCIATNTGDQLGDSFIIGSDFGALCPTCPTVVIRTDRVRELLRHGRPSWDIGSDFTVLGQVNFAAVPEDKQNLPFDDDNPVPLVPFLDIHRLDGPLPQTSRPHPKSPVKKSPAKRRRKARRR